MSAALERVLRASRPLRRDFGRLGWPGRLGAVLVLLGGVLVGGSVWQARPDANPVKHVAGPAAGIDAAGAAPRPMASPTVPEGELHESVNLLFRAALAHKLELAEGDYRLASAADASYRVYSITLPVKGSYEQLRAFLAECLRTNPKLSLDALEFRREQISEEALQTRVKFSMFIAAK